MDDYPYDLGQYSFPVTTAQPEAQRWFDRGLIWTYGFPPRRGGALFRTRRCRRPGLRDGVVGRGLCGRARITTCRGTCSTRPGGAGRWPRRGRRRCGALARIDGVTAVEAALIRALPARYPQDEPVEDMTPWDDAFADAMRVAFAAHPESLDLRTVFVDAMLNRTPWRMWDLASGSPAEGADTLEAQRVCEEALEHDPRVWSHPGLLHLYVHLMEMSPHPERALKAADVLRTLVPDAGHLVHMPTHIDVLCGQYHDVVHWNRAGDPRPISRPMRATGR